MGESGVVERDANQLEHDFSGLLFVILPALIITINGIALWLIQHGLLINESSEVGHENYLAAKKTQYTKIWEVLKPEPCT